MYISDNIKRMRTEKGLTLEGLAQLIGTSKQTIHKYENGQIRNIPWDKIEVLAKSLNTSPMILIGCETPKPTGTTAEQALQALLILEAYAYENIEPPKPSLNENDYNELLNTITQVIISKANEVNLKAQETEA